MAGWTNRGKFNALGWIFVGQTLPTFYYVALVTSATAPTADIDTLGELTQINVGNGYSDGGFQLTPGGTDFDIHSEDDGTDRGRVEIKDVFWTATGGPLPISGSGARYAVLTDDNGTIGSREVIAYFDLGSDRTVSQDQTLTLQDCELRINES